MSKATDEYERISKIDPKNRTALDTLRFETTLPAIIKEEDEATFNPDGMSNRVNKLVMAQMGAQLSKAEAEAEVTEKFAKPSAMMRMVKQMGF